jgi:hypothetical protein
MPTLSGNATGVTHGCRKHTLFWRALVLALRPDGHARA